MSPGPGRGDQVFQHQYVQELLLRAQDQVEGFIALAEQERETRTSSWLICVRTYGRAGNPRGWPDRTGKQAMGILQLTLAALERALGEELAHKRCLIFVSHEDPDFTSGRLTASLAGSAYQNRVIVGVKGADLQARFIEESFPLGSHVIIADDNIGHFVTEIAQKGFSKKLLQRMDVRDSDDSELKHLLDRAGGMMRSLNIHVWGINASTNPLFVHAFGETVRKRMKQHSLPQHQCDYSTRLGLVYGAFFGILVQKDPDRYTRWGQIKDDVERSLRYWHRDGAIMRFKRYAVEKLHKPGVYKKNKGGISSGSSADLHAQEVERALNGMLQEFAGPYGKLPEDGQKAPYGLILKRTVGRPSLFEGGKGRPGRLRQLSEQSEAQLSDPSEPAEGCLSGCMPDMRPDASLPCLACSADPEDRALGPIRAPSH